MSTEANKAIIRRLIDEVVSGHRLKVAEELIAADAIDHDVDDPEGRVAGFAGAQAEIGTFLQAFPDLHATIDDLIAEDDRVVLRARATGTHKGEFLGLPATGKPFTVWVWQTFRVVNGKVAESWLFIDRLGLMQQLGAIPAPAQAPA
jgi:steroid delta-isomerase-like uncharacterized protein